MVDTVCYNCKKECNWESQLCSVCMACICTDSDIQDSIEDSIKTDVILLQRVLIDLNTAKLIGKIKSMKDFESLEAVNSLLEKMLIEISNMESE